jgi:hypothetical protein
MRSIYSVHAYKSSLLHAKIIKFQTFDNFKTISDYKVIANPSQLSDMYDTIVTAKETGVKYIRNAYFAFCDSMIFEAYVGDDMPSGSSKL